MKFIQTILGPIPTKNIGITDAHEHLIRIGGGEVIHGGQDFLMNSYEAALKEINLFKKAGGNTIVEMTPCGSGRDIGTLLQLSKNANIQIIATTGFHKSSFYDQTHFIYRYSVDEISQLLINDLVEGIDLYDYCGPLIKRSKAKAGVIKAAVDYQTITDVEKKVLYSAAKASVTTGFPISLHLEKGTMASEVVDILVGSGVSPNNIILGHIDRNPDLFYHTNLARKGVYLIYDGPGRVKYYSDEIIARLIEKMVEKGWEKQILIGADLGRKSYFKSYHGGPGLDYNLTKFLPRLQSMGLSEKVIKNLFCKNAEEAFANKKYEL